MRAVVGALGVLKIEDKGQALLGVVFGAEVALFEGAVRTRAFAWIVNPAHEVIVIVFFADAAQVGSEIAAEGLIAFAHGVAGHAAAGFESGFAARGVARGVLLQCAGDAGLPDEGGDGLNLVILQAEHRHLGGGAEVVGALEPDRDPIPIDLHADFFEAGADFLFFAHERGGF